MNWQKHIALAEWQKADIDSTARAFKLTGRYVTPPVMSRPSIGLITHVIQSVQCGEGYFENVIGYRFQVTLLKI